MPIERLRDIRTDSQVKAAPSNLETAVHTLSVNATWEDWDVITALNLVIASGQKIPTGKRIQLFGVLECINSEAVAHTCKYASGETPDNDDTVVIIGTTMDLAQSYFFYNIPIFTDASGNIKVEVDDVTKMTLVFHLTGWRVADLEVTA